LTEKASRLDEKGATRAIPADKLGKWRMDKRELLAAIETLAGAVVYLCSLQRQALDEEIELAPGERRHAIGPLTNDRDVIDTFHGEALRLRDRAQAVRRSSS
jgi:hypothetical protein